MSVDCRVECFYGTITRQIDQNLNLDQNRFCQKYMRKPNTICLEGRERVMPKRVTKQQKVRSNEMNWGLWAIDTLILGAVFMLLGYLIN